MTGLVASGFSTNQFLYGGFLNRERSIRIEELTALSREKRTVIILETPYRLMPILEAAAQVMPNRNAYIGCNLTMPFETHHYGTFSELLERFSEMKFKGEFIIIFEGANAGDADREIPMYIERGEYKPRSSRAGSDRRESSRFDDRPRRKYSDRSEISIDENDDNPTDEAITSDDDAENIFELGEDITDNFTKPDRREGGFKREGGFNRDRREGGFKREGGFNRDRREGGFKREGGFNRDRREGGFKREGGFNNDRREGGFNNDRREGGFNSDRREGGFKREGGFNNDRREGGFKREGGFNSDRREGGFKREGGFNSDRREGGFKREGGFNNDRREGGFKREGGFNSDRREGGFKREGGFSKGKPGGFKKGGFGKGRPSGGKGGFRKRDH
jgi:hypothetical protein